MKPQDCWDSTWSSITAALNTIKGSITIHRDSSKQDFENKSQAFCASWTAVPTNVLFTAFRLIFRFLSLFQGTSKIFVKNGLPQRYRYTYLVFHVFVGRILSSTSYKKRAKFDRTSRMFLFQNIWKKLPKLAVLHRKLINGQYGFKGFANLLRFRRSSSQISNCQTLSFSHRRLSLEHIEYQFLHGCCRVWNCRCLKQLQQMVHRKLKEIKLTLKSRVKKHSRVVGTLQLMAGAHILTWLGK